MRDLKTEELNSVSGGTGWFDKDVGPDGRYVPGHSKEGEAAVSFFDPLGNTSTGFIGWDSNEGASGEGGEGGGFDWSNAGDALVGFGENAQDAGGVVMAGAIAYEVLTPFPDPGDVVAVAAGGAGAITYVIGAGAEGLGHLLGGN